MHTLSPAPCHDVLFPDRGSSAHLKEAIKDLKRDVVIEAKKEPAESATIRPASFTGEPAEPQREVKKLPVASAAAREIKRDAAPAKAEASRYRQSDPAPAKAEPKAEAPAPPGADQRPSPASVPESREFKPSVPEGWGSVGGGGGASGNSESIESTGPKPPG